MSFERREVLRRLGILAAAVPVTALFPEAALGRPRAGQPGKVRVIQLFGGDAERSIAAARRHPGAAAIWDRISAEGLADAANETMAVRYQDDTGAAIGESILTTFRHRNRTAQLIQHRRGNETKAALAMWHNADPTVREVYRAADGGVVRLGTIRVMDDEVVVEDGGRTMRIPRRPQIPGKSKAGALAAISDTRATTLSDCRDVCGWIVGVQCGMTCEYSFFVLCSVILALGGLPGLACFLVSFATCFWTCHETQQWACQTLCS